MVEETEISRTSKMYLVIIKVGKLKTQKCIKASMTILSLKWTLEAHTSYLLEMRVEGRLRQENYTIVSLK